MNLSLYTKIPFMVMKLRGYQRLKPPEIKELQNKKLRALVKHSYDHVPYYHSLFNKSKIYPNDIKTIEDLKKIPISKKMDLCNLPVEKITANNFDLSKCEVIRTSGTTGIPFTIYYEKKARLLSNHLQHYINHLNCGEKITNKRVIIAMAWMPPPPTFIQKFGIFRTKNISPFNNSKKQLEEIKQFDAKTLIGIPSCVQPLAKEIEESDNKDIKISLLFTGGELLDEFTRKFLKESFEANLFDCYGAAEAGRVCGECIEHNYHVSSDTFIVGITRDGETVSAGEDGEIIVTNLVHYAQPIIRYNLEDFGIMMEDECACGCYYPLMNLTSGRASDFIQLSNGRVVSAHEVNMFLTEMQGIKQFQVIQETTDRLTVKIVKGREFADDKIKEIKQMFSKRLGNIIEINVLWVDHIPREKSGKFKIFKTNVS